MFIPVSLRGPVPPMPGAGVVSAARGAGRPQSPRMEPEQQGQQGRKAARVEAGSDLPAGLVVGPYVTGLPLGADIQDRRNAAPDTIKVSHYNFQIFRCFSSTLL